MAEQILTEQYRAVKTVIVRITRSRRKRMGD